jgi:glycosyltransferase involved in cell wall biosynthesis
MRVLLYLGDKQWSGCARAMLASARGLVARGHQITIACCADSRMNALAQNAGLDVVAINSASTAAGGVWDLRKVLHERFVEVVVVTTERDQLIVSSAMRLAERGAVLRRVPSFDPFELQRGGKLALKIATAGLIVTTDRELKTINHAGWSIPASVVPIGVDVSGYDDVQAAPRSAIGAPPHGLLIGCSYNVAGRNRIATVFRTLSLLAPRHPNMHVVVVGPGSLDEELRMHAAAVGVGPVFTFLGEREDELNVLRAADVGWVAAESDSAAYGCLDFMGLHMAVIAERSLLTQHYVADGISGLLLSPGDPSYTASEVAEFLATAEKYTTMGNAGRTRVQRDFTETAMIDAFERAVEAAGDRTKWTTSA